MYKIELWIKDFDCNRKFSIEIPKNIGLLRYSMSYTKQEAKLSLG